MPDAVARARAAVARDLGVDPRSPVLEAAARHRAWWLSEWPDGAPHVLGLLAQDVQEAVHERDPTWPVCPEPTCPEVGRHALLVEPDLGPDPFWTCHRTGLPVAAVGSLRAQGQ
ncbi:MAG TPA: hypothetical protein VM433_13590 [Mycobacteriales bacterium]|nr:hypothetical protein [Mycobacteriales bacterium]